MYLDSLIKSECCGCGACVQACAIGCISMEKDDEGFLFPVIRKEQCVNCEKCKTVCPMDKKPEGTITTAWAGIHKNKNTAEKSASGGAFFAIAEKLVENGYAFFGACWDENNSVIIDSAGTLEECERFRKSKYLQADTNGCFKRVKELLDSGKKVVFSGLPCQVAALKTFLGGDNDNLLCVDIICHGVPNQEMFDCEISYLENKYSDKVLTYEFRNKRKIKGEINSRSCCITFKSGKEILCAIDDDPYLKAYYTKLIYRISCGRCPFAQEKRYGDITLGDAWNVEQIYSDFNPVEGVSLVLTSTKKVRK